MIAIPQKALMNLISRMHSDITLLKILPHVPGTNGLNIVDEMAAILTTTSCNTVVRPHTTYLHHQHHICSSEQWPTSPSQASWYQYLLLPSRSWRQLPSSSPPWHFWAPSFGFLWHTGHRTFSECKTGIWYYCNDFSERKMAFKHWCNGTFYLTHWPLGDFNEISKVNCLWSSDAIWRHRLGSTLAQVMAYWHQAITWTNVD